jgi:gluconate 2-dehydrogenase gamma chain
MTEMRLGDDIDWLGAGDRGVGHAHRAILEAAVVRVIPSDEDPGAREAGTIDYVLSRARQDTPSRQRLIDGARLLERLARETGASGFVELTADAQDALLAQLDRDGDPFFERLVVAVMEGFYGDPRHGGNQHGASWAMLGFPGPQHPRGWQRPLGWYDEHVPDEEPA